ncbi:MAG: efflux RND transporter periplasmic adaptor subunit [Thermoguttaceae bacterium]
MSEAADPSIFSSDQSWEYKLPAAQASEECQPAAVEKRLELAEWEAHSACALMDILVGLEHSEGLAQGCAALVNDLQKLVGCRRVVLGICGKHPESFRLLAVSGMAAIDRRSEFSRTHEAVLAEAILRKELTVWPLPDGASRQATLAHQKLSLQNESTVIVSSPIRSSPEQNVAAWIFLGSKEFAQNPLILAFLRASEPAVAASLDLLRRAERNRLQRWWHNLAEHKRKLLLKVLPVALAIVFLALWIPWPYKIHCKCRLQPTVRRFVAAPYEGVLEKSLVEPGDVVQKDQVLARMDGREIRLAISDTASELKRAELKRKVQLVKQDQGAAKMAALEKERMQLKLQLLESRSKKLEIKSPLRGVVLLGDQKRAEGMPVTLGQNLFEVAPLNKMVVEVAIPERDFNQVKIGQNVRVKLDAFPAQTMDGKLLRLHPRAEEWNDDYVFVGEMLIENPHDILRPGMNGRATIYGKWHTLYWNLFHRLWENVMIFVGW